jgi:hypothetical protein
VRMAQHLEQPDLLLEAVQPAVLHEVRARDNLARKVRGGGCDSHGEREAVEAVEAVVRFMWTSWEAVKRGNPGKGEVESEAEAADWCGFWYCDWRKKDDFGSGISQRRERGCQAQQISDENKQARKTTTVARL